jgi:peptidoglycan/LPS O-acetylase OafA/YrhL
MTEHTDTTHTRDRVVTLDVLRCIAILLVVFHHIPNDWLPDWHLMITVKRMCWVGVDLFFVLSGWLIGGLFFREELKFGNVDVGRFWLRRWMRTLPPYFVVLTALALLSNTSPIWTELAFLQNYQSAYHPTVFVSWSLCIEEHFYLVLPILLVLAGGLRASNRGRIVVLPILFGALIIWRTLDVAFADRDISAYYHWTHFRADGLLIGVWLAAIHTSAPTLWNVIVKWNRAFLAGLMVAAGVAAMLVGPTRFVLLVAPRSSVFMMSVGYTLIALVFGGLLIEALHDRSVFRWFPRRIATPIALASYSIYLTHYEIIEWVDGLGMGSGASLSQAIILVAFFSAFSYYGVEQPSIRLRDKAIPRRVLPGRS